MSDLQPAAETAITTPRDADAHLVAEAQRLAAIADRFGLRSCGDSCHQLRLRAEAELQQMSFVGKRGRS